LNKPKHPSSDPFVEMILESLTPIAPSEQVQSEMKANLLAKVEAAKPVTVYNMLDAASTQWESFSPLISYRELFNNGKTTARLIKFAPGGSIPTHRHRDDEAAFVVEGWCTIGELTLRTGDYHMVPTGASHAEIYSAEGCILFLHGSSTRSY
jgi:quercetin dioxygenase-like cupin family protein